MVPDPIDETPGQPPILMYGLCPWRYITNRPQNLALALASHADVVYIDPPVSAGDALANGVRALVAHLFAPVVEEWTAAPGVTVLHTRLRFPWPMKFEFVRAVNTSLLGEQLRAVSKSFAKAPVLWVMYPADHRLFEFIEYSALVYDLVDRHSHFAGQSRRRLRSIERSERWLFENADLVTATAASLADYARSVGAQRVMRLPNGCDPAHFAAAVRPPRHASAPVVGFVGAIGEWIDFDAIRSVAESMPNARVLLAGPFHAPFSALPNDLPANVEYVGVIDFGSLPDFMRGMDLTLVPFRVTELTSSVNPVKAYEYLAAGKPVLTTPLPEMVGLEPLVTVSDAAGFGEAARTMLAADTDELVARRVEFARRNSWSARAETGLEAIRSILGG